MFKLKISDNLSSFFAMSVLSIVFLFSLLQCTSTSVQHSPVSSPPEVATPTKVSSAEKGYSFTTEKVEPIKEVFVPHGKFNKANYFKVAAIHRLPKEDADLTWTVEQAEAFKQRNRKALDKEILKAILASAKLVVLPEFAVTGYPEIPNVPPEENNFRNRQDLKNFVETIPGPSTDYFSKIAKTKKIWIQFGLAEVDKTTDNYYNAAVVVGPTGEIVAHYRKQNLYGIENKSMLAGSEIKTFLTPAGKVGVVICADTYKEKVLEAYKNEKVDVLLNSSAWAEYNSGIYYWTKAAQKVGAYLVASNDAYAPDVAVINPDGTTQSHARQTLNTIVYGYLPIKNSN